MPPDGSSARSWGSHRRRGDGRPPPITASRKVLRFFAVEADLDVTNPVFGEFEMEWPPRSGERRSFPEVDRVAWVPVAEARDLLAAGQRPALDALLHTLGEDG